MAESRERTPVLAVGVPPAIVSRLEDAGFEIGAVPGASEAMARVGGDVECVLSAQDLPDSTGLDLLGSIRERYGDFPFVLLPASGDESLAAEAVAADATEYVPAGADPGEAVSRVARAAEHTSEPLTNELKGRVLDAASIGITVADYTGKDVPLVYANEEFEAMTGYAPEEVVEENCRFLQGPDTDPDPVATMRQAIENGEPASVDVLNYRRDGTEFWNHVDLAPVEMDGEVTHYLGFQRDVTARKRLEQELRSSDISLRELYRAATDADASLQERLRRILDIGRDRLGVGIAFVNRIEEGEQHVVAARGDHPLLQEGETGDLSTSYCRRTIEGEGLLGVQDAPEEGWADDPAFETYELYCYLGGKLEVGGDLYGTVCFADTVAREEPFSDSEKAFVELVTQWIAYELERDRREQELQRKNERLEDFASIVSHDLRNPLNLATGRLEVARETGDSEHLDAVADALERMSELIDDVLTLAREGDAVSETEAVSLGRVVRVAADTVEPDFDLDVEDDLPTIRADEERLRTLLENLLRNATDHAGPDPTIRVGALEAGFYLEDDGPGIPEEERETVFESGHTTDPGGTGFGLAIVRDIAEAHGWEVRATEGSDGGARFEITGVETASIEGS